MNVKTQRFSLIAIAVFFLVTLIVLTASASTTISTNIQTDGTLSVTGASTLTGLTSMGQASSTRLSVFDTAYFGGTATSSFTSAGVLTLQNGETISNATNNLITITAASTTLTGTLALTGGIVTSAGLASLGTIDPATTLNVSGNVGRVAGFQLNLVSSGSTVTGFRGIDSRVTDTGTAANIVALQGVATKSSGVSAMELWGTNSIVSMTGGSVLNAYGVVGDLTIGTGAIISADQLNSYATAGYFNSYVSSGATLTKIIDSAIIGQVSSNTGRGKSPKGTFGITSILNGATSQSTAGASAAYKVLDFNTDANFDYGLDLYYSDSPYSNVFSVGDIRLNFGDTIKNTAASTTVLSSNLTLGNNTAATSTVKAGCVVTTATSSATSIRLMFNTSATTTTLNGNTVQGVVLWGYGSSCAN